MKPPTLPQGRRRDRARDRGARHSSGRSASTTPNSAMLPLLDTHQHLIYPDPLEYGWTAGLPALAGRAFTVEDYQAVTARRRGRRHDLHGGGGRPRRPPRRDRDGGRARPPARQRHPRHHLLDPPGERPGLRRLGRGGAATSAWSAIAASCTWCRTTCRGRRPSAPTSASSARAGCRSTCACSPASCRSRWSWRAPARTPRSCSTTAATPTSPAARVEPWRGGVVRARRHAERHRQALRRLRQLRARHRDPRRRCAPTSST